MPVPVVCDKLCGPRDLFSPCNSFGPNNLPYSVHLIHAAYAGFVPAVRQHAGKVQCGGEQRRHGRGAGGCTGV